MFDGSNFDNPQQAFSIAIMKMKMRLYSFVLFGMLGRCQSVGQQAATRAPQNSLLRHYADAAPKEYTVDPAETYNTKFMALMKSPCRPELDGYFGSTYGTPVEIQYGFKMETQPLAPISAILSAIDDNVVDNILMTTFPTMCGYSRRSLAGHATGFWFQPLQEEHGKLCCWKFRISRMMSQLLNKLLTHFQILFFAEMCQAEVNKVNFCGTFQGRMKIFGIEQGNDALNVLSLVVDVLNTQNPAKINSEIVKITPIQSMTVVMGGPNTKGFKSISNVGKAGIAVAIVIVVTALLYYYMSRKKRRAMRNADTTSSPKRQHGYGDSTLKNMFLRRKRNIEYDPEEKSIKPAMEAEAENYRNSAGGAQLLLTDARSMQEIDVDHDSTYSFNNLEGESFGLRATSSEERVIV